MTMIVINPYVYPGIDFKHTRRWMDEKKRLKKLVIAKVIAESYNISLRQFCSRKKHYYASSRAMCAYILCEKMEHNETEVGRFLGVDRTTICAALKKIKKQLKSDMDVTNKFFEIDEKLKFHIIKNDTND